MCISNPCISMVYRWWLCFLLPWFLLFLENYIKMCRKSVYQTLIQDQQHGGLVFGFKHIWDVTELTHFLLLSASFLTDKTWKRYISSNKSLISSKNHPLHTTPARQKCKCGLSGIYLHTNVLDGHTETSELKVNKVSVSGILSQFNSNQKKRTQKIWNCENYPISFIQ